MNKLEVQAEGEKNRVFFYPEKWDELTDKQLKKLLPILPSLYQAAANFKALKDKPQALKMADTHLQHLRIKAFWILLDIPLYKVYDRICIYSLFTDELIPLLDSIDFILQAPNRVKAPFPYLGGWGSSKIVGPDDGMKALTAEEYHFAMLLLNKISKANEDLKPRLTEIEALMRQLCFVLYRPKGKGAAHNPNSPYYKGDVRTPFNRFTLETQTKKLQNIPFWKVQIVVWWFGQLNRRIQKQWPRVFSGKREDQGNSAGWLPIFRMLAKDPLKTEEIGSLRLSALLYELNESINEADRLKIKNAKR